RDVRFRLGRRVTHGLPGYEQMMAQDFEFALIVEAEDVEALKRYLHAPAHDALAHLFYTAASAALAYDYEIVAAQPAAPLLEPGARRAITGPDPDHGPFDRGSPPAAPGHRPRGRCLRRHPSRPAPRDRRARVDRHERCTGFQTWQSHGEREDACADR